MNEPQTEPPPATRPLIYGKIAACLADVRAVGKDHRNQQQGYSFRSIDDFYDSMSPVLAKHGIFICPTILEHSREERQTKSGGLLMTTITKVRYRIFAEDGSFIEADALGEGADSGDKSANKAAASAMKYLFMQVFAVRVNGEANDSERESHNYAPQHVGASRPPSAPNQSPKTPPRPPREVKNEVPAAKPADILPRKATAATLEWFLAQIKPIAETALEYAIAKQLIARGDPLSKWPLEALPTSRPELALLTKEITEFALKQAQSNPVERMDGELPPEIAHAIIVIPRKGMKKAEYLKNPDTIGSLYAACENDEEARKRLFGMCELYEPVPWKDAQGKMHDPSPADYQMRKDLDAFSAWREEHEPKDLIP